MKGEISAGVIGVGSMGKNHARVYSDLGVLGGIADRDIEAANELASRFRSKAFEDYKEMLKTDIDAVTVATPTQTHFQIAMTALDAGKHVLIEKPICSTLAESEKLVQAAEDAGLTLAVGLIERHNPVVKFAKESLASGQFGELVTITARRVSSFPSRIRDVGVIMDLGVHDLDVLRYLVGKKVDSVYTLGGKQANDTFEDHANVLLEFEDGTTGFVEINWLTPMKVRKVSLTCTENFVELDYTNQSAMISSSQILHLDSANLYQVPLELDIRNISLKKKEPLMNEQTDFLQAILKSGQPLIAGRDGLETIRIAEAAIESLKSGRKVEME